MSALQGNSFISSDVNDLHMDDLQKEYLSLMIKYKGRTYKKVSLKDFDGTVVANLKPGVSYENLNTWGELLENLQRMAINIENHSERFLFDSNRDNGIRLFGVNGKFYVGNNGNHTMTLLKAKYLSELKRADGDPQKIADIDEKYTIEVDTAHEVPMDKEELVLISLISDIKTSLKADDIDISEYIEAGKKVGYTIVDGDNTIVIKNNEELRDYVSKKMQLLQMEPEKYIKFMSLNDKYKSNPEYKEIFERVTGILFEKKVENTDLEQSTNETNLSTISEDAKSLEEPVQTDTLNLEEGIPEEKKWMDRFKVYYFKPLKISEILKQKMISIRKDFTETVLSLKRNIQRENEIITKDGEER